MKKRNAETIAEPELQHDAEDITCAASSAVHEILRQRARTLAAEPENEEATGQTMEVVEFILQSERYAVTSSYVREVLLVRSVTPVPCAPDFVAGLVDLRGEVIPVIDLRIALGLGATTVGQHSRVIILQDDNMEFGILADAVPGVLPVSLGDLKPGLPTVAGIGEKFLLGVTTDCLAVLDAAAILSDPQFIVHEEV